MMARPKERRYLALDEVELRADGDGLELAGYGAVFNAETVIWDAWRESVEQGAYAKTIQEGDIRALFNHDPNIVLGRNQSGTLRLSEDDRGLLAHISAPDNEWGRPVRDAIQRRDVTGMSVMFEVVKFQWIRGDAETKELPRRIIKEARLYDVGPVTFPAFPQTSIAARSDGDDEESGAFDIILEARALVRCAQLGMALTRADSALLRDAAAILQGMAVPEPEPDSAESDADGHHSDSEPEPGAVLVARGHHSAAAERDRWLALIRQTL